MLSNFQFLKKKFLKETNFLDFYEEYSIIIYWA